MAILVLFIFSELVLKCKKLRDTIYQKKKKKLRDTMINVKTAILGKLYGSEVFLIK